MNLVSSEMQLSDIFIPFISALVLAFISFILFYFFKRTNNKLFTDFQNNHQINNAKKKAKKKSNLSKGIKSIDFPENVPEENRSETKHIGIKSVPEIMNNDIHTDAVVHQLLQPGKPILRKTDEEIFVSKEECQEALWTIVPKDEVEILRSRHSSVVSELRLEYKGDEVHIGSKLSRGQKKRLKTKLKSSDSKGKEIKIDIQANNSAAINLPNEAGYNTADIIVTDKLNKIENKRTEKHPKNNSLTSSGSSHISDKNLTFESEDKCLTNDSVKYLSNKRHGQDSNGTLNNLNFQSFVDDFKNSEDRMKLEREIEELKEERHKVQQKLSEFQSMQANFMVLKKDNELHVKKYDDLERTCNTIKKELTSSIQKYTLIESQFIRYKAEKNQHLGYYENEISKLTNKVNILENDNRAMAVENESLKDKIDKMHHLVSEKDENLKNQNNEISSLQEQLYKKRIDCQEFESQIKNANMKLKDVDTQKQLAYAEIQKLNTHAEILKKETNNVQNQFDILKRQSKAQEQQQDAIISSFQYQIDEFLKEKQQQSSLFYPENVDKSVKSQVDGAQVNTSNNIASELSIPDGYELIEKSTIKKFTSLIKDGNQKLQEKCEQFNGIISEYKDKETDLLHQNALLNDKYSKLNTEFKGHLNEIVHLRKSIETLQQELSKNSETTIEEMKLELDDKSEMLRKTTDILMKLESSVEEEEIKWRDSLNECKDSNAKLMCQLKSQDSLLSNQNQRIEELSTQLKSYNNFENESSMNGALSGSLSETSNQ